MQEQNLVEVKFDWSSVELRWHLKDRWYVRLKIVKDKVFYQGQLEDLAFSGEDSLRDPKKFPRYVALFKERL